MGDAGWGFPKTSRWDSRLASAIRNFRNHGSTGNIEEMFKVLDEYDESKSNPIAPPNC
jgi:hypothetical protein